MRLGGRGWLGVDLVIDGEARVHSLADRRDAEHRANRPGDAAFAADHLAELVVRNGQTQDDGTAATPGANLDGIWVGDELSGEVPNQRRQALHRKLGIDTRPFPPRWSRWSRDVAALHVARSSRLGCVCRSAGLMAARAVAALARR